MRRPSSALTRILAVVPALGVGSTLLTSCGGSPAEPGAASSPASTSAPMSDSSEDEAGDTGGTGTGTEDTYVEVTDPATQQVPLGAVDGIEGIRFWEGTEIEAGPSQVSGTLDTPEAQLNVVVLSRDGIAARPSSRAEARAWAVENGFMDRPGTLLEPVVVDGVEMEHVQGGNSFAEIECFIRTTDGVSVFVLFVLPDDLPAAERDQRIGEVMATVDLS